MFVKICGITNEEDALLATALGADALGFVFAPSMRQVGIDTVKAIVRRLPYEVVTVGVFRNERPERVVAIANQLGLHGVQLHRREPRSEVRWVRDRVRFVIQGYVAGDPALRKAAGGPADIVLIDSPTPGSGQVFDWSLAEGAPPGMRVLLAGGLTPDNVAAAIDRIRPFGVDVSSGVEAAPGHKDPRKVRRFVEEARRAAEAGENSGSISAGSHDDAGEPGVDRPYDWMIDE